MVDHNPRPGQNGTPSTQESDSTPDELLPSEDVSEEPEHSIAEHPEDQNSG